MGRGWLMEQALCSVWVEFYRQIQARSGSGWVLDTPMALGRRRSPFWALWAAAEILKTCRVGVVWVTAESAAPDLEPCFFVVLVFFVVWPLWPD